MKAEQIKDFSLTRRERDILGILWNSEGGMIASDISKTREDLTINTVQAVLKKLLRRQLIEVAEIVYSGTVLSRKYRPTLLESEFAVAETTYGLSNLRRFNITPTNFLIEFIPKMDMSLEEVDEFIEYIGSMESVATR